jgi:hypothetical protein
VIPVVPLSLSISNLLAAAESFEGTLVTVMNVALSGSWPSFGNSGNVTMNDGSGSLSLRVDQDGQLMPTNVVSVTGIFTQFSTSDPCPLTGYQILSRTISEIVDPVLQPVAMELLPNSPILSTIAGQAVRVQVIGQDRNGLDTLTFDIPTNPTGAGLSELENRVQEFEWIPGPGDEGTTNQFAISVSDGSSSVTSSFEVVVLPARLAGIVLNEIHYDPAAGLVGDANGDGVRNATTDEFIEIVNVATGHVDIANWVLKVNGTDKLVFPPATVISSETAVVVFNGGNPMGSFGSAQVFAPSGGPGLGNNGSTVALFTDTGIQVFSLDYSTLGVYSSNVDQSLNRNPDLGTDWSLHTTVNSARRWSPGTQPHGAPYPGTGIVNSAPSFDGLDNVFAQVGDVVVIPISATDPDMDALVFSISNAPPSGVFADMNNGTAALSYTGLASDAGTTRLITLFVSDGINTSSQSFNLDVPDAIYTGLRINEFMSDPNGGGFDYDSNRDGVLNGADDEFVELVNGGTNQFDLAGLTLWDDGALRHTFGTWQMAADSAFVVFGGGDNGTFTASGSAMASTGGLILNNGGDSVRLYTPGGLLIDQVVYSTGGSPAPVAASSLTRNPEVTGNFVDHWLIFNFSGDVNRASPGLHFNQSPYETSPQGPPDDDMDGIPNSYEVTNGLNPNEDGTIGESIPGAKDGPDGALGDKDLDGVSNFDEYVALTDASDPLKFLRLSRASMIRRNRSGFITVPDTSSERIYFLEARNEPGESNWTPVGAVLQGTDGELILEDVTDEPFRVYRLGVQIPAVP